MLADERRACRPQVYPLVITGAGALPLPTKQPPKLNAVTTNASASATFFMDPPIKRALWCPHQRRVSSLVAATRPPVQTKKDQVYVRLCTERDGAKYRTVESAAVGAEVRVIVFHKR